MSKPVYGVRNVSGVGGWCPHIVILLVVKAGSNVISSSRVDSRIFSTFGTLVGKESDSWWSEWGLVKIE